MIMIMTAFLCCFFLWIFVGSVQNTVIELYIQEQIWFHNKKYTKNLIDFLNNNFSCLYGPFFYKKYKSMFPVNLCDFTIDDLYKNLDEFKEVIDKQDKQVKNNCI